MISAAESAHGQAPARIASEFSTARKWGSTQQGVRVNLTLDKFEFQLGEDIVAHIAVQVVDTKEPVYGEPFVRVGAFFQTIAGSFHLTILDADGPIENSDRRTNIYEPSFGSSGPSVCPKPLEVGKVVPLDRSLHRFGLLPIRPGTYQLSVTWSPYHSRASECSSQLPVHPEQPFVTVTSNALTVTVLGNAPPSNVPQFPEYTAWREHFSLVDTAFGPQTALLDYVSGLEWLRPSITSDSGTIVNKQSLTIRMLQEREFSGWRFATISEVKDFFAHFTGSPDGSSHDPAIERKLLRLLGGALSETPDPQSGWITSGTVVRIAELTSAPAVLTSDGATISCPNCGPAFWAHAATVGEVFKEGQLTATIDTDREWRNDGKQENGVPVLEGGKLSWAGFFLVHQQ